MSGALWFYFWSSGAATASTTAADVSVIGGSGGGGKMDAEEYIDWEALSQARESYLKSQFTQAKHHVVAMAPDWPDPILKPRKKRPVTTY